jgi:hypothetical protein
MDGTRRREATAAVVTRSFSGATVNISESTPRDIDALNQEQRDQGYSD